MQCVIHETEEAIDACRGCGKPLCARCGTESQGTFVCARCRALRASEAASTQAAPPGDAKAEPPDAPPLASLSSDASPEPVVSGRRRSPAVAALLSFLPGLGQLYNGEPLKFLAFLSIFLLLVLASVRMGALGVFTAFFWFYQVFEAFHTALGSAPQPASRADAAAAPPGTPWSAWVLIGIGVVVFLQNLTGMVLPHRQYVIPALVILAGLRLLFSYFRTPTGEGATS